MTDSQTLQLALGGAAALGGLGWQIYNTIDGSKKINKALRSLQNYNGRIRNAGLSAADPNIVNLLKEEIKTKVPVAIITDKKKINELGIGNNAFFATPGVAKRFAKELNDPSISEEDVAKYGAVFMSDKFGSLPILAHELGHAKDYEEGNLESPIVTGIGSLLGSGLGIASMFAVPHLMSGFRHKYSWLPGAAGAASGLAIFALTNWWANRRTLGSETRASDKAKVAISRVAERLGKQKELNGADKMLDQAFSTYETRAKTDNKDIAARAIKYAGMLTALAALKGL